MFSSGEKISSFLILNNNENAQNKPKINEANLFELLNKNQIKRKSAIEKKKNYLTIDLSKFEKQNYTTKINKKEIEQKDLFPLYYYFLDVFIDKLVNPKTFCYIDKKYLIVYNFLGQIFDISSHILLFKHFNILKNLFINEITDGTKNINIFNNNNKININDDKLMAEVNKDLKTHTCDIFTKTINI